ncbi:hypothetical protein [Aquimarina algiphila]|uniref:Erythromycin esterase family protein n=1 Tax=Aquimarina algiphila TaxID=2047982 RepID=A0A554VRS7_9FLAO|nr:hypothetical protein [Aquimarina algiphila]TSE11363.1 hypothetical protein FOF46_01660 [Aquimarina algiphila]
MNRILCLLLSCTFLSSPLLLAQNQVDLAKYSFEIDDFTDQKFVTLTQKSLENSQFVFVGEQHGIKEAGTFTKFIYDIAQPFGYKTLCIETDALAAEKITAIASSKNPIDKARSLYKEFPFSIPFYSNQDDYDMFTNTIKKNGEIWGIDQTFMVQFGLNFDHMMKTTSNKPFKNKLIELKKKAKEAFTSAITNKDFNATYIFSYDENTHKELLALTTNKKEIEILNQLWKTKEIYAYNTISKEYYKNNQTRGQLMKSNFMRYYKEAKKNENTPKVIFKLGANHAAKGLTRTHIYDIANMGSELAITNDMHSLHYIIMGIHGKTMTGNPFTPDPIMSFDNTKQFPEEIQNIIPSITKKYYILDLVPLRYGLYAKLSKAFRKIIFGYDVIVLVNNAEAVKGL